MPGIGRIGYYPANVAWYIGTGPWMPGYVATCHLTSAPADGPTGVRLILGRRCARFGSGVPAAGCSGA